MKLGKSKSRASGLVAKKNTSGTLQIGDVMKDPEPIAFGPFPLLNGTPTSASMIQHVQQMSVILGRCNINDMIPTIAYYRTYYGYLWIVHILSGYVYI